MIDLQQRRQAEIAKYVEAYKDPDYKMGDKRKEHLRGFLELYSRKWQILDVGCGRGELLEMAFGLGWARLNLLGLETDRDLLSSVHGCLRVYHLSSGAHSLALHDGSYDLVTCCDVMEHLLEEDVPLAIAELYRVCSKRVLLTVAYFTSGDYHITVKPREWWLEQFSRVCDNVIEHDGWHPKSGTFELVKDEASSY